MRALARVGVGICLLGCMGSAFSGCFAEKKELLVFVPDGAPALALARVMSEDTENDGVSYTVVDASTIAARVTNRDMEKNADFCVLPVSAASKILGNGEKYRMLGLVTQGNLYLVSKKFSGEVDFSNPTALDGKTMGVLKMNEVPGLTLRATLGRLGVEYGLLGAGETAQGDRLNLQAVDAKGIDGSLDYYLVAEPQASKLKKAGFSLVGDLQALYALSGGEKQRVAFARAFACEHDLLLLDEPFSSLDTALKIRLMDVFAKLWEERRQTAVLVTHDLEEAWALGHRIILLKDGKIALDIHPKGETFPRKYGSYDAEKDALLQAVLAL